jgi:peroxiredoxin
MIAVGENAPGFTLQDQFARKIGLGQFNGRRHVMLLFYPLDFTPT